MYKRQALNYITIVLAVSTIGMAIYTIKTKENILICTIMMIITVITNYISNKFSDSVTNLNKKDKELLEEIKKKYKK